MQTLLKTKIGPFLVISSVLALWTFLVAQHVQAHEGSSQRLPTPSCSGLPGPAFFGNTEITAIDDDGGLAHSRSATKQGGGVSGRGNTKYQYAKITIPALAAGELRVFDAVGDSGLSDAYLCRGSSTVARSITSYSAHDSAHTAADRADGDSTTDAAAKATDAAAKAAAAITTADVFTTNADATTPSLASRLSTARSALSTARSALSTARTALGAVARALYAASVRDGDTAEDNAELATTAEQNALTAYNLPANALPSSSTPNDDELNAVKTALGSATENVGGALTAASAALTTAATNLRNAAMAMHTGFKIRASVMPGDEEYIVVASQGATAALTLNIAFHGAIDSAAVADDTDGTFTSSQPLKGSLTSGNVDSYTLTVNAPGLLTVGTTGSTDTVGTLDLPDDTDEVAHAEAGGSENNFQIVVPITADDTNEVYTLSVEGQTSQISGDYTLDMDFKVAMSTTAIGSTNAEDVTITADNPSLWAGPPDTSVAGDDTTLQIRKVAEGSADEDYFLLTPAASGLLTVQANDDGTDKRDSNTRGTLFGAMEIGPLGEMRTGEIATDADGGPGNHFKFTVPVLGGRNYLVQVDGTDGVYRLEYGFALLSAMGTITPPSDVDARSGAVTASTGQTPQSRNFYLVNIAESGALYLHTTGSTDVVGTFLGPDGKQIAMDDNSGDRDNFRIATNVEAGLYLLEVKGIDRDEEGPYALVSNFVTGAEVEEPTTPTTPTTPPVTTTPVTDATGFLENPPNDSTRSGIGIINGWVCEAETVTITIRPTGTDGSPRQTFNIGYGGDRPDTVGECDHSSPDTGFGMAFNFNRLAEAEYQITASADGERIGAARLFTVIYLDPDDTFLEGLEPDDVDVPNFPAPGRTTTLEWEESLQNFVIKDVQ